ncbi:hypothetical protein [Pontibacter russatus]|uniref:hypothetical protein n=1 Tax=Pontibacter russatus TaxID=2694929 RepID=UPI00137AB79A|nr:hypothetical protein [Pontibacter russatus]
MARAEFVRFSSVGLSPAIIFSEARGSGNETYYALNLLYRHCCTISCGFILQLNIAEGVAAKKEAIVI